MLGSTFTIFDLLLDVVQNDYLTCKCFSLIELWYLHGLILPILVPLDLSTGDKVRA